MQTSRGLIAAHGLQVLALSMEDVAAIASAQPQVQINLEGLEESSPRGEDKDDNDAASTMSHSIVEGIRAESRPEKSGRSVDGDASAATLEPASSGTGAAEPGNVNVKVGGQFVASGVWLGRAGRSGHRLQIGLDRLRSSHRKEVREARRRMDGMQVRNAARLSA
jgi:hypothetical protein